MLEKIQYASLFIFVLLVFAPTLVAADQLPDWLKAFILLLIGISGFSVLVSTASIIWLGMVAA